MAELLLALQLVVLAVGFPYLFRRDRLFGVYFLFLMIYALPAEVGYLYLSELSQLLQAYFGEAAWYPSALLVLLSATLFVVLFALFRKTFVAVCPLVLDVKSRPRNVLFAQLVSLLLVLAATYEIVYLLANYGDISWFNAQAEDGIATTSGFFIFLFLFKFMVGSNVALYVLLRQGNSLIRPLYLRIMFVACVLIFVFIAIRLANRTDLLAFVLGIAVFESYKIKFTARKALVGLLVMVVAGVFISMIDSFRYEDGKPEQDLATALLVKDYYAPAHMLFAAVAHEMINPVEVAISNTANALVKLNYPYLQNTITDEFRPGVASRSAGYAFYVLTEGYMFAGNFGFIYNAVLLMLGLSFWRKLAMSNSADLNLFLLAIMGCMLVNLVRSQSAYFIKYLYTFVAPATVVYICLAGMSIRVALLPLRSRVRPSALLAQN